MDKSKKFYEGLWSAITKIPEISLGIILGATLPLFLGKEMKETFAHRIFVFFLSIERALMIIPRLIYLLAFIITLLYTSHLRNKISLKNKGEMLKRYTYIFKDLPDIKILLIYKNPVIYREIDVQSIIEQSKIKFICAKCSKKIIFKNKIGICPCNKELKLTSDIITQYSELARKELSDTLLVPIIK